MSSQSSVKIWDEVFSGVNLSYSENPANQNQLFDLVKNQFLEKLFPKNSTMLEVGCGVANVSLYFAKRGYKTVSLDLNPNNLNLAKKNFKKEKADGIFVEGDAEKLPFADNQFDVVSSFGLLEHFENPKKAIAEMIRVLKPGGFFFADIVPKRFSCQTFGNIFNFLVTFPFSGYEKAVRNFKPLYFENSLNWKEYQKIMEDACLEKIEVRGNRPFPRLTLPPPIDNFYTKILKTTLPFWQKFDKWDNSFPRFWGAGLWFWGKKLKGEILA